MTNWLPAELSGESPGAKLVYRYLRDADGPRGTTQIAEETDLNRRSVQRLCDRLREVDVIETMYDPTDARCRRYTDR